MMIISNSNGQISTGISGVPENILYAILDTIIAD